MPAPRGIDKAAASIQAMSSVLSRVRQLCAAKDFALAEKELVQFIGRKFNLPVGWVGIRDDGYSLNSVNGFVRLLGEVPGLPQQFFFKFHQEEGEESTIKEYYLGELLRENGYPIDVPLLTSKEVGEQILLYSVQGSPRLADACREVEKIGCPADRCAPLVQGQQDLDHLVLDRYKHTLHRAGEEQALGESLFQLFYWRLADTVDAETFGGRVKSFYLGQDFVFPGLKDPISFEELGSLKWEINGVRYAGGLRQAFGEAKERMNPAKHADYPAVVGHGDAHNANVWFKYDLASDSAVLSFFDPAFAGRHLPALLAEIKPTFHNILAHPDWLYHSKEAKIQVSAELGEGVIRVTHGWILNPLRRAFWDIKRDVFWKPWLAHLNSEGMLPPDWRAYIRSALFCCPALVINLRAGAASHTPETSLLGTAMAVMLAHEPEQGSDLVSDFLDAIAP